MFLFKHCKCIVNDSYHRPVVKKHSEMQYKSKDDAKSTNASIENKNNNRSDSIEGKVGINDFNFIKVLGKGTYGKVILAEKKGTEVLYAVKILKKDLFIEDNRVDRIMIEKQILTLATEHPFLTALHSSFQTWNRLFFVMEYMNGGDLMFQIQKAKKFVEERASFYAAEITLALQFLHSHGVVYCDLKLENVVLDQDVHCKLADFGMCKEGMNDGILATTFCGTPYSIAPQIIQRFSYGLSVDWWSLGVLMYVMLAGHRPFVSNNFADLLKSILNDDISYPLWFSDKAKSILQGLMTKDPVNRLGCSENEIQIKDHILFSHIDWKELELRRVKPPFQPTVKMPEDASNLYENLPKVEPKREVLTQLSNDMTLFFYQDKFAGFSFVNENFESEGSIF